MYVVASQSRKEIRSRGLRAGQHVQRADRVMWAPAGEMHAWREGAETTACGQALVSDLHVFPHLSFPRGMGRNCRECRSAAMDR